jgi:UDP-glucose 4-epimerase
MSTVLVTGGSGFIGSHVVDRLLAAGHEAVIFDLRPSEHHPRDEVPFVRGDVADVERLCDAMCGCDAVIHMAAAADVNAVEGAPLDAEERNARGTLNALEAARRSGVERFIYASTIWVYSDTPAACQDESCPLRAPAHIYSATKLAGELYCHSYRELYGVESTILRFGIPYGPRARPGAVIPAFVSRALAGEPLTVAGDGTQSRRFVYVEDLAAGVVAALDPLAAGRTYNLVGAEDVSIAEIAYAVRAAIGDVVIERVPGRKGDYAGAPVSGARAAEELGWAPTTGFDEGLRRYVAWHTATARRAEPSAAPRSPVLRRPAMRGLLRRASLAFAWAAATAAMIIGIIALAPVDQDMDRVDVFAALLVVLAPIALAGGFAWDGVAARRLRAALWAGAGACFSLAVLPWPSFVGRFGHGNTVLMLVLSVTAGIAAQLPGSRTALQIREGTAGH